MAKQLAYDYRLFITNMDDSPKRTHVAKGCQYHDIEDIKELCRMVTEYDEKLFSFGVVLNTRQYIEDCSICQRLGRG